jgi:ribosomal protein L16 Arg81 hydroxylase
VVPRVLNLGDVLLLPPELSIVNVRRYENALNDAVTARFPANAKLVVQQAPTLFQGDFQNTAVLGCPHPNGNGHNKLAATLKAALG